jgi:hypothetical protein
MPSRTAAADPRYLQLWLTFTWPDPNARTAAAYNQCD